MDGNWYSFDANGLNCGKRWYTDGSEEWCYLDESGVLRKDGRFKIKSTNSSTGTASESWYYALKSGAVLKGGSKELEGRGYYSNSSSYSYRRRWMDNEDSRRHYIRERGFLYQNQWFIMSGLNPRNSEYNSWCYADSDGYVRSDD